MWKIASLRSRYESLAGAGVLLDLPFSNRERLVGDVKVGDCLGQSDHEIVEFSVLGDVRRVTSKTAILNFQRADFDLFRTLVAGSLGSHSLRVKGSREAGHSSRWKS